MNEFDPAEIVERLKKGGKISQSELHFVRARLRDPEPGDDLYDLMRALGLGVRASEEDVALVESYFMSETDDWNLQGSIYALCDYWGLTEKYLDRLLFFVRLENWDEYSSAAIASFGALGDYLHKTNDPDVYAKLLELYDTDMTLCRTRATEYDEEHLASVYRALDMGIRGREALLDHIKMKIPDDIKESVINEARKKASKKR